ncbi:HTTM domain-containing protein [Streptomyces sp. NBC_01176]|uniref:HTTM domain-containing protein n=1 Tax=Streptomyces sp. NBC_01176 TaxID=2903760 RepID=UPI00386AD3F1|nr:HTTM domain-containing protein [Streptomyces sp. NBC_01176]
MKKLISVVDRWSSVPLGVIGVSGTRALLGFVGLMFYVSQYADRDYLFGPTAVLPWRDFVTQLHEGGSFSLYAWSSSEAWSQLVFHLGLIAALMVTLGIGGRAVLACHWVLLWSLYERQPVLLDGGDNLAYLVLLMLLATRCYDRFSLSSGLADKLARRVPAQLSSLTTPLHNLGVVAVAAQMCLVYVVSGLYKVQGQMWQDGTALFYVLRVPEFSLPGVSNLVYGNDFLVVAGTYVTVIFLVYFPLGVLVPALRPWAAALSISFHLAIAVCMGLTGFALTMIACDLVFLDKELGKAVSLAREAAVRLSRWVRKTRQRTEHAREGALAEESV